MIDIIHLLYASIIISGVVLIAMQCWKEKRNDLKANRLIVLEDINERLAMGFFSPEERLKLLADRDTILHFLEDDK